MEETQETQTSEKEWWKSKILAVNVLSLFLVILEYLKNVNWVKPEYVLFALAICNAIMRIWFTNTKLK